MYDPTRFSIGMNVKQQRLQLGLSYDELAALSGISAEDLARLEAGYGDFPIGYLFQLAPILHIRASTLVEGEEKSRIRAKAIYQALIENNTVWEDLPAAIETALKDDERQNEESADDKAHSE